MYYFLISVNVWLLIWVRVCSNFQGPKFLAAYLQVSPPYKTVLAEEPSALCAQHTMHMCSAEAEEVIVAAALQLREEEDSHKSQ
jgi:hypothetical protein